jgi:hypothetical protein
MKRKGFVIQCWLVTLAISSLFWVALASGQSQSMPVQGTDADLNRQQLRAFDGFLDSHPDLAQQLQQDPSLINKEEFVANHPDLQQFLQGHPLVQQDLSQNPNGVMHQEQRYERHDINQGELALMDHFLDNHPEIAEQLRKNPSLVDNRDFVSDHPELQEFLAQHPAVRGEFRENPNAFMHQEERFDQPQDMRDRDLTRGELANMDRFMDSHPEIAEQLRKNPSLVNNKEFIEGHPALQQFLANHPELREEYKENPQAFMHQEERFDRREDMRDRDTTRGELANMDRFMDSHPEIAEQLRKNPSLVNNKDFTRDHPELQEFLTNHPELREEYKENPQAFMHQENNFDRHEGGGDRSSSELSSFGEFLGSHSSIAGEVSNNPSLATNKEYLENHAELRDYLKNNPKVQEGLNKDPQAFVKQAQQIGAMHTPKATTPMPKVGTEEPKLNK